MPTSSVDELVEIMRRLRRRVDRLRFGAPVEAVYNPLAYAWKPHRLYLERYGARRSRVLLHGMNPGPCCGRREVSGRRLWGWARARFETPERFFHRFFVHNYCPLCFLEEGGRNRTPDRLPAAERDQLMAVCDDALRDLVELLVPERVVGVGRFAQARARAVLSADAEVGYLPHPSPARPRSGPWADAADRALRESGIELE